MGLDQYIHKVRKESRSSEEFYWREFGELQNLMHMIYERETGNIDDFNCEDLVLTIPICDEVISAIKNRNLPSHEGFFFGGSNMEDDEYLDKAVKVFERIKNELQHTPKGEYEYTYSAWY